MKILLFIPILFISFVTYSQPDPEALIEAVSEKMKLVENYRADLLIRIDVDFINIKERSAVVYYEKPDKYDIKVKGLVLMPKKGSRMEYYDLINSEHNAIYTGEDTLMGKDVSTVKIIPVSDASEIILAKLWIGKDDNLIHRMQSYTQESGSYTLDIFYANHPLNLPDKIKVTFDMKGYKLPATMTGDYDEMAESIQKSEITKGVVWLEYSNYVVNYLNKK